MLTTLMRQAGTGLRVLILFTVLPGIVYPLVTLAVVQLPGLSGPRTARSSSRPTERPPDRR